mgnify:CR=1 FL=1
MAGIILPVCAVFFSLLLTIVYFSKKRIDLVENKIYSLMVIVTLIDSILVSLVQGIGLNGITSISNIFISLINKIDFMFLVIYSNCLLFYIILITYPKTKNKFKLLLTTFSILDAIIFVIISFGKVFVISNGSNNSVEGSSLMTTLIACGTYIFSSIIISIINIKKIDKRHIPVFASIAIAIFLIPMFRINPYLIVVSITLTYINYIMYFTIENPDVKMVKELEVAKSSAEKANKAKSEFLSSMSHELRTPLNAIVCFSELLETKEGLDEESKSFAKDIVSASHNLLELVNGVLDISKIEAGKMELINKEYNPYNLFNSLGTMVIPRIGDKNITFETHLASDLPGTLKGDTGKIKQIVLNLLTNAVKYTDEGYISYKVNSLNDFKNNKCYLYVTVTDSGRGIKPEDLDRLFVKFERLDEDKNSSIEGTGLGLAITQSLANLMGGKITVVSKYGEGSTFKFVFVQEIIKEENEISLEEVKEETLNYDFTGKNILVVDDSKLNLRVAQNVLKVFNANVMTSTSGQECLDLCKTNKYDIILMDIMMPLMNGIETLKRIRIDDKKVPVIALTADAVEGMEEKYLSEGFNDYLSKPIDKNKLGIILNKYLKGEEKNE